jgi:phospholipid/cholesterol/gamma-HCH transport system permease protein
VFFALIHVKRIHHQRPVRRYHGHMTSRVNDSLQHAARAPWRWAVAWWRIVHFGALIVVLALSPSSYGADNRRAMARHIYQDTAPVLTWFTVLCALVSLVITRIVVVTALSYGLTQYAMEMVIRVLVLELIPLTAALFVALRCTIPNGAELAQMRRRGLFDAMRAQGVDPVGRELLPRVVAGMFSVITLAALSCVVAMVLAYLAVYGFTAAGLPAYTRMFGQVFNPAVTLVFMLKTLFFSLAVSLMPMAAGLYESNVAGWRTSDELQGLVRVFAVLVLIEVISLVGNYY